MGIIYEKRILGEKTILDEKLCTSKTLYNLYFITSIEINCIKDSY